MIEVETPPPTYQQVISGQLESTSCLNQPPFNPNNNGWQTQDQIAGYPITTQPYYAEPSDLEPRAIYQGDIQQNLPGEQRDSENCCDCLCNHCDHDNCLSNCFFAYVYLIVDLHVPF